MLDRMTASKDRRMTLIALMVVLIMLAAGGLLAITTDIFKGGLIDGGGGGGGEKEFVAYPRFPNIPATSLETANNEPTVAVNPIDPMNIVAGSNDYGTPSGDAWVGYMWSRDGGKTWKRDLIPGYDNDRSSPLWRFQGAGDPVLAFGPNGDVYMAGIAFNRDPALINLLKPGSSIFVAKSTDGGETFPQVVLVTDPPSITNFATFHDKEWIAVDPITGDVHVTWTAFQLYGISSALVHSVSRDGGRSWTRPKVISEITQKERQVQGSQVEVDSKGVIHVAWIEYDFGTIRYTRSKDGGDSFETARTIASVVVLPYNLPNNNYRTPTMCDMAIDDHGGETDGTILLAWPDHRTGQADILATISTDGGDTWSTPVTVNNQRGDKDNDQFFPAAAIGNDGSLQVMFYDRRDDPENDLLSVYFARSIDGGLTYQNIPMSEVSFDGENTRGPFIGDYLGLSAGPGWTIGVWCDSREGTSESVRSDIWTGVVIWSKEGEVNNP
jgi:hypothetical protein